MMLKMLETSASRRRTVGFANVIGAEAVAVQVVNRAEWWIAAQKRKCISLIRIVVDAEASA